MTPRQILLMRHAEKPDDVNNPSLSDAGKIRAEKLADYVPQFLGIPDFLFASAISKHSVRSIETITPLSKKIGVPIDETIADQDFSALADDLLADAKFDFKLVLVCWHHGFLPDLAFALGASHDHVSHHWDPLVFDLVLQLDYSTGSAPIVTPITEPF